MTAAWLNAVVWAMTNCMALISQRAGLSLTLKAYPARSPENFCGFFSSNLPGNCALRNAGDFR